MKPRLSSPDWPQSASRSSRIYRASVDRSLSRKLAKLDTLSQHIHYTSDKCRAPAGAILLEGDLLAALRHIEADELAVCKTIVVRSIIGAWTRIPPQSILHLQRRYERTQAKQQHATL
jgi:hypothetical protein